MEQLIIYEENEYGLITLNRPQKRNAISKSMAVQLLETLDHIKDHPIKCLVIQSNGENVFCAGGDLTELHGDLSEKEAYEALHTMKLVLYKLLTFPVPTICLLQGNALGGGCELATACDFRIAKEDTNFGFVQSNLGILPGWGGGAILYEKIASSFAFKWLTKGSVYDARHLYNQGWIQTIVHKDKWMDKNVILQPFLKNAYEQMLFLKSQYLESIDPEKIYAAMDLESKRAAKLWPSKHHQEAVQAFLHKK